ncbi:MAG: Omp28-related outer membrane protein [Flavobacteriales bacterium]|nr:Omp28-related outer membrane protein [Flavobacteriales bacterium]
MKKYIYLFIAVLIFASCDKLEGPFMTDNIINPIDTSTNSFVKKILIEDFTGHTCPNCPDAARELDAIHEIYGDQIIGMAVHVGKTFARPFPLGTGKFEYDFRTTWGETWDSFFGIGTAGLPKGMINRIDYPNDEHRKGKNEWGAAVQAELNKDVDLGIVISSNISGESGTISINTKVLNNISGSYNLVVCLTEDTIINWQKDGQVEVENYEHKHVLRTVLNSEWGEQLTASTSLLSGDNFTHTFNINLTSLEQFNIDYSKNTLFQGNGNAGGWNADNMNIVAYIYNTITKEILQVEETHLNN